MVDIFTSLQVPMTLRDYQISILYYWNNGVRSAREISRICNIPVSTVHYNLQKLADFGCLSHRRNNGRRTLISASTSQTIGQMIRWNKEITAASIASRLTEEKGVHVSRPTVHRHLRRNGYKSVLPRTKPMLTPQQRERRLQWAVAHKDDDWANTIFSDETSIQLFRNTLRRWSKDPHKEVKRIPKNRQKIMVWGAISTQGTLVNLFTGIMNAQRYIDILTINLLPAAHRRFGNNWRFQQDNDPKHTARITNNFLSQHVPSVIDWPSNSPDLNPIENVWGILKRGVEKSRPTNVKELMRIFMDEWTNVDKGLVNNLISSMKSRCEAVILAKGDHIDY